MGVVRTVLPCRAIRGLCVQKVSRYFSTHYICILQALNWVRPCAWVRLPFPRHLVSPPVRARRSVGWALILPEISTMGPRQGIFICMCGCGSLTGRQAPELSRAVQHSIDPGVCLLLAVAPHGMIRMTARLSCEARGSNGLPRYIHSSSQARVVITVLLLCLSAQNSVRPQTSTHFNRLKNPDPIGSVLTRTRRPKTRAAG